MQRALSAAEAQLAKTYKAAITGLRNKADSSGLEAAQKAWTAYRDSQCTAEYAMWGGHSDATRPVLLSCRLKLTKQRIQTIQDIYLSGDD